MRYKAFTSNLLRYLKEMKRGENLLLHLLIRVNKTKVPVKGEG